MFHLQGNELVIEDYLFEHDKIFEDLLADCAVLKGVDDVTADQNVIGKKRRRNATTTSSTSGSPQEKKDEGNKDMTKRVVHRENEKQRRQEMASLYSSLRSLIPLEYIRGKRSVSDHMQQAVNYIKHMQKKIEEMQMKRDKLKKLSNPLSSNIVDACTEDRSSNIMSSSLNCVNVSSCRDGVEVLISSSKNEEAGFPLSKVLVELIGRGHNVSSYISTIANDRSLHKIQIQDHDLTCIDLVELQEKLTNVIKHAYH